MKRGQEVRSNKWFGVRFYVGTSPYGKDFIVPKETFDEVCEWFDSQESRGWQSW